MSSLSPHRPALLNLEAHHYVDPALYRRERETIFKGAWIMLGPATQLAEAGDYLATEIAAWKLFVVLGRDGVRRGFLNVCRHRGARLLPEGQGRCELLRCPYHHWLYDAEGRLKKAPFFGDDPGFRLEDWSLQPLQVATWRGLLFVALAPQQTLAEQLGDLPDELAGVPIESYRAVASETFRFPANWKTYTDNFVEGYHIPGIHPAFHRTIEFEAFETVARDGLVSMTAPQKGGSIYGGKWLWLWPNWTLSLFPGGMNTSRIVPRGVDETELVYHFYFADTSPAAAAARQRTIETNCAIVREDFEICEHTQKNYAAGAFVTGPLSPRHEQGVAYFQRRVLAALG